MKNAMFAVLLAAALCVTAQKPFYQTYDWKEIPTVYKPVTTDEKNADYFLAKDKIVRDIWYDKDGQATLYETSHRIYHVNNSKAVDQLNKIYMSKRTVLEEVRLQARCITPSGKVIFINSTNVKNVDDLDGEGPFKIFAIDGVEPGCDVEVLYTNKKSFQSYGFFYAQGSNPVSSYESHIISPVNLVFEAKTYNGLAEFKSDTGDSSRNHIFVKHENLPPASAEKYSTGKSFRMAFVYQLAYNTNKGKGKIYTWDIISREIHANYYIAESKDEKALKKAMKQLQKLKSDDERGRVIAFDAYLKNNYHVSNMYSDLTLEQGLKEKKLSERNAVRFYVAALKELDVAFELGVSCDRNAYKLDKDFPSYLYTTDWIIYFPNQELFVSPVSIFSRPGFPDPDLLNNLGLFVKEVRVGDLATASAKTRMITGPGHDLSYHNMEIKAGIDLGRSSVQLKVKQLLGGYSAFYVQPVYKYMNEEQRNEIHQNYFLTSSNAGIKNLKVLNTEEADLYTKSMELSFENTLEDFLQKTADKYILNVGMFIGTQAEMYEEKERSTPVDMNYPHHLLRNIEIKIPEGYRISNLADMAVNKTCVVNGNISAIFRSECKVENDKILLNIYEDYKAIEYPVEQYQSLKEVINAAADFNKKRLILERI